MLMPKIVILFFSFFSFLLLISIVIMITIRNDNEYQSHLLSQAGNSLDIDRNNFIFY